MRAASFDGVNRFYVDEHHHGGLRERLSYPACVLDRPFARADDVERREALERATAQVDLLETVNSDLRRQVATIEDAFVEGHAAAARRAPAATRQIRGSSVGASGSPDTELGRAERSVRRTVLTAARCSIPITDQARRRTSTMR